MRPRDIQQAPSGAQWVIEHGDQQATVVEVGGGLRTYTVDGIDVLAGYPLDEQCSHGRGQVLMPWPNRLRDGRYEFLGVTYQLPLTEPARRNASHGLVRWVVWTLLERSPSTLTVGYRLHPQPGWPGRLDLTVTYELSGAGLSVLTRAVNVGSLPAPFGCGAHPYIAVGETPYDDIQITIPASEQVLVDADRKLPVGVVATADGVADFRVRRPLAGTRLDTAFTGLQRGENGRWSVHVAGLVHRPDVSVWADGAFDWVQVFTDHALDDGVTGVRGVAVEPLSCPPDAFNSGTGLVVLEPGEDWSGQWGITCLR